MQTEEEKEEMLAGLSRRTGLPLVREDGSVDNQYVDILEENKRLLNLVSTLESRNKELMERIRYDNSELKKYREVMPAEIGFAVGRIAVFKSDFFDIAKKGEELIITQILDEKVRFEKISKKEDCHIYNEYVIKYLKLKE